MPTWKKLGGTSTDTNLGNSDLTHSEASARTFHLDNSSGSLKITDFGDNDILNLNFFQNVYGNTSNTLLHTFNTYHAGAEGGAGAGMEVIFAGDNAHFTRCDYIAIESDKNDYTAAPKLLLRRENQDGTAADNDVLGRVVFEGRRSNGVEEEYADIQTIARDVTNATEDGELLLRVKTGGALSTALAVKSLAEVSNVKADAIEVYGQTLGGVVRDSQDEEFVVSGVVCRDTGGSNFVFGNAQYGIMAFNPSSSGTIKHFVVNFQSLLWSVDFEDDDATFGLFKNGVSVATLSKNVYGETANTHFSLDTSCDISYTASDNFEVKWTQDGCSNACTLIGLSSSLTCRK